MYGYGELRQSLASSNLSCFYCMSITSDLSSTIANGSDTWLTNLSRSRKLELVHPKKYGQLPLIIQSTRDIYLQDISRSKSRKPRGPLELPFNLRTGGAESELSWVCHFSSFLACFLSLRFEKFFSSRRALNNIFGQGFNTLFMLVKRRGYAIPVCTWR
jgi:hypothetical protein